METYNQVVLTIYKIQVNNLIYIGSTFNYEKRLYTHNHRTHYKGHAYHLKLYKTIRECYGDWNDNLIKIIDIYNLPEKNKQFKLQIEQCYIKLYNSVNDGLNTCNAILDVENKLSKQRLYSRYNYKKNRTKLLSKVNCDCGSVVGSYMMFRHKKTIKHQKYLLSLK